MPDVLDIFCMETIVPLIILFFFLEIVLFYILLYRVLLRVLLVFQIAKLYKKRFSSIK